MYKKLKATRPRDTVINAGIGSNEIQEADFYVFPNYANGLNTFSKKDARYWQEVGMKGLGKIPISKIIKMELIPVNNILEKFFFHKAPDIISLDVEGLDMEILKAMNFQKYSPAVICVETLLYDDNQKSYKNEDIINFMLEQEYIIYADTRVNTIFCKKALL